MPGSAAMHIDQRSALLERLKPLLMAALEDHDRQSVQIDQLGVETALADLPLDSLATVELLVSIEETFGVAVSEQQAFGLETIGDVIDLVQTAAPDTQPHDS